MDLIINGVSERNQKRINKFLDIYKYIYLIIVHGIAFYLICGESFFYEQNIVDIILQLFVFIIIYAMTNLVFFFPFLFLMALSGFISLLMAISTPVFLILSIFQLLGSENVNVLEMGGFFGGFLFCLGMTIFGSLNLLVAKKMLL